MQKSFLLVSNFLSSGARSRTVGEELAIRLSNAGWNTIMTSSKSNRVLRLIDMVGTVLNKRKEYQVAYVELYGTAPAVFWAEVVCWALRKAHKPYILTLHGGGLPDFAHKWPKRINALLNSADAVTAPSRYMLENMNQYRSDIILIPNAIDVGSYTYRCRTQVIPALIWLRAFHHGYNPTMAVDVLAKLALHWPNIRLIMLGPDKGDGSLQKTKDTAEALNVLDKVSFPGLIEKSEVPNRLEQGDIFLNTTNYDNVPVSILEAMACGLCVVSTNAGGLPYLLTNNVDALVVPVNNPDAMADAVQKILTVPTLGPRLSANARSTVEGFDWSVVLPKWENLLNKIMQR